jgi:hypothetical protein
MTSGSPIIAYIGEKCNYADWPGKRQRATFRQHLPET